MKHKSYTAAQKKYFAVQNSTLSVYPPLYSKRYRFCCSTTSTSAGDDAVVVGDDDDGWYGKKEPLGRWSSLQHASLQDPRHRGITSVYPGSTLYKLAPERAHPSRQMLNGTAHCCPPALTDERVRHNCSFTMPPRRWRLCRTL